MSSSAPGAHILVFPHPAQGHLIPILDFTYHLSTRGLSITVLVTPKNLPLIQPLLSRSPTSIQPLILPFPTHPSIPPGVENAKDLPPTSSTADIVRALSFLQEPIIQWFDSHPNPPVAIVSDFFLGWTEGLARRLSVPRIVFYSSGPFLVSVLNHLWLSLVRPTDELVGFDDLPNKPSFGYPHLPSVYRRCVELGSPGSDWEFMREGMIANTTSWGAAYNTFEAMEGAYLEHVREKGGHVRTWAVGPVFAGGVGSAGRGGSGTVADGDVISWLDECPDGSVVYVCFGSEVLLTRVQMAGLAAALEKCGARFVWVVKVAPPGHAAEEYGVVPDGFEERTAGRGLVIRGWAPQAAILGHPAVAAFLTHCGWNSVLEGLAAGVTLLAWPMGADQFVNARLLVEDTGVAVRVCEGLGTVPDSAELARAVAESLSGSRPERVRAMEMKKVALDAVKEGGSSYSDLDGLVKELSALAIKKNGVKE
ncbi:hypothetical protein AAC387_Pa05g1416 [Persea americana]